jgi:quercetin dioxygenase-like cupin family protein
VADAKRYSVNDLAAMGQPPEAGILSQTLHGDGGAKVVLFGLAAGEELSEHTSSRPATIHVLSGDIELTLDGERTDAGPGTWVHMAPGLPHALRARAASVMLLTLFERDGAS